MVAMTELAQTFFELPAFGGLRWGRCLSSQAAAAERPDPRSDETLMREWQAGDPTSFPVLYSRFADRLFRFVLRMAKSRAEAEEICQESWMAVVNGLERYRSDARFVTYLFSIAHRRSIDRRRRDLRHHEEGSDAFDALDLPDEDALAPERIVHSAQNVAALLAAIDELPPLQREAFLMQAEGGLSLDEIATATGAAREAVKSRLRYALRRLRAALGEQP